MSIQTKPTVFYDKYGIKITPGCVIKLTDYVRVRQRPGGQRIAEGRYGEGPSIVPDEGDWDGPKTREWVAYRVKWSGSCLVACQETESNLHRILDGVSEINLKRPLIWLDNNFNGKMFEVIASKSLDDSQRFERCKDKLRSIEAWVNKRASGEYDFRTTAKLLKRHAEKLEELIGKAEVDHE